MLRTTRTRATALLPRLLALLALLVAPAAALAGTALGQERALVMEDWSLMRIAGAESGYVHTRVERVGDGEDARFEVTAQTRMRMNRMGATIDVQASQLSVETADGTILRMESSSTLSSQTTRTVVLFEGGRARVSTTVMGETRTSEFDVPPGTLGLYGLERVLRERSGEAGARFRLTTWSTDLNQPVDVDVVVVGPEEVVVGGEVREAVRYETTLEAMGGVRTVSWADQDGRPLRTSTTMMGLELETLASDEESCRRAYASGGKLSADVFRASVVVAEEFLPSSRSIDRAELVLTPRSSRARLDGVEDARQRVLERREDGTLVVELRRVVPPAGHRGTRPVVDPPGDLAESLAASSFVQCDHPEIVAVAREVVGDERDPWRAAQALERWVEANVTEKSMDVGFATALEVCTNRAGDCTEHAVLLCALARAAGIPSRVAMGLLYIGGIWGGHAWTEVWVDGQWYALDATIGAGSVDAVHLTLARMNLAEGSPMADFAGLLSVVGEVDLDVRRVRVGPVEIDLGAGPAVRVDGTRYENRLWGLSFELPEGFEVEPQRPTPDISFELVEVEGRAPGGKRVDVEVSAFDPVYARDRERLLGLGDGRRAGSEPVDLVVDGRPARYVDGDGLVRVPRRLLIDAGDRVFLVTFSNVAGDAQAAVFEGLVASIDLDLGR